MDLEYQENKEDKARKDKRRIAMQEKDDALQIEKQEKNDAKKLK